MKYARTTYCGLAVAWLLCSSACLVRPGKVQLRFVSSAKTNGGHPLSILVRRVDGGAAAFRRDSYQEIERLVTSPDSSVLRSVTLLPQSDKARCIDFPYSLQSGYAIYALYASAQGDWKVLYEPTAPHRLVLVLGPSGIDLTQSKESRPPGSARDPEVQDQSSRLESLSKKVAPLMDKAGKGEAGGPGLPSTPNLTPPAVPTLPSSRGGAGL